MSPLSSPVTITTTTSNTGKPFRRVSVDEMLNAVEDELHFGDIIPDVDGDELDLWDDDEMDTAQENALLIKQIGLTGFIKYRSDIFNMSYKERQ